MHVSLVALDLDDTLLSPDLTISQANLSAVQAVLDTGVPVVLASGRTIESMEPYARQLGMFGRGLPIICVNGAEIRSLDLGTILRHITLSPDDCAAALEVLREYGLPVQAYEEGVIIVSEKNDWTERDSMLTGLPNRKASHSSELASIPRSKLLASGDPVRIAEVLPTIKKRLAGKANVLLSKPYFMEILPMGADKEHALAWVASRLSIPQAEVMAIGDAQNDLGMIRWAGFGCAPADAIPEILGIAKYRSRFSHEQAAVADLLERLVLVPGA